MLVLFEFFFFLSFWAKLAKIAFFFSQVVNIRFHLFFFFFAGGPVPVGGTVCWAPTLRRSSSLCGQSVVGCGPNVWTECDLTVTSERSFCWMKSCSVVLCHSGGREQFGGGGGVRGGLWGCVSVLQACVVISFRVFVQLRPCGLTAAVYSGGTLGVNSTGSALSTQHSLEPQTVNQGGVRWPQVSPPETVDYFKDVFKNEPALMAFSFGLFSFSQFWANL